MLTLNDGRNELWQWDTGRKLTVDAECSQVHFSNKVFGRSIDVDVVGGVAIIPDILLQTDMDLIAWAFVGTAENGYTKISKVFKVNRRNKPADYVFTPPEQTTLGEILERLDDIESAQDPDAIKNAVYDYLDNNPIHTEETDPTVPAWAKQPTKPGYTAEEVGALDGKSVYYWKSGNGGVNDVFDIVLNYPCGIVTDGRDNSPTGMTFPAFVITGAVDRWYKNFSVIDNGGKFYRCVADLRTLEATVTPIYPSAEDVGALPNDTVIPTVPTKVSAFVNDKGYQTEAEVNALINAALAAIPNAAEVAY